MDPVSSLLRNLRLVSESRGKENKISQFAAFLDLHQDLGSPGPNVSQAGPRLRRTNQAPPEAKFQGMHAQALPALLG